MTEWNRRLMHITYLDIGVHFAKCFSVIEILSVLDVYSD